MTAAAKDALFVIVTRTATERRRARLAVHVAHEQADADALEALHGEALVQAQMFTAADLEWHGRQTLVGQVLVEAREALQEMEAAAKFEADMDAYLAHQEERETYEWEVMRAEEQDAARSA